LIYDKFGQVAVCFFDAAFSEVAAISKKIMPGSARPAAGMGTRTAHGRYDQIPGLEALDRRSDLDDLGQRLVADHQVVITGWRGPVLEVADLLVSAADANVENPQLHLVGMGDPGIPVIDDFHLVRGGEHRYCPHFHLRR